MNDIAIDPALLAEAETLNVNVARAAAKGIADAVELARSARWREENRAALESSNTYFERNGLPLAPHRFFCAVVEERIAKSVCSGLLPQHLCTFLGNRYTLRFSPA